jgi:hypothetical protein
MINSEFQKNIWSELSSYKIVVMTLTIIAIYFLIALSSLNALVIIQNSSVWMFFAISVVWGARQASESILNELIDHTWDGQRMSILTPWQLTWGKIFGSTLYSWYGGILCLIVLNVSSVLIDFNTNNGLRVSMILIMAAVSAHASSILMTLIAMQKNRKLTKNQVSAIFLFAIFLVLPAIPMSLTTKSAERNWFVFVFSSINATLIVSLLYSFWTVLACYKLMKLELQMRNSPWTWISFVFFNIVFFGGIEYGSNWIPHLTPTNDIAITFSLWIVPLVVFYFMLFSEKKNLFYFETALIHIKNKNWKILFEKTPRWLITFIIFLFTSFILIISTLLISGKGKLELFFIVLTFVLFATRDIGIIFLNQLYKDTQKADMHSIFYLAILYLLLPIICEKLELNTYAFWPSNSMWGWGIPLVEVLIVGYFMKKMWKIKGQSYL